MDQKGFTRPLPISASRVSTIRSTSPSLPKRFGAGTQRCGQREDSRLVCLWLSADAWSAGEPSIDENEAKIVLRISRSTPRSVNQKYCRDLTREACLRRRHSPQEQSWSHDLNHQCITGGRNGRGILGNELYVGVIHWNVRSTILNPETQKKQKRRNPEEHHLIVMKPELRIVPQKLWDMTQKLRSERAVRMFGPSGKPRRREVVPRNNEHPLAGTLRCGVCNGHMRIAQSSRDGGPRAACANAHQRGTCEHTRSFDMDVILKDVCRNIDVKLLSPKAIEEAMSAWQEERKNDRKKGSERETLERRRRKLTAEIERLSYAIANSRRKPDELLKLIDECDLERENIDARLQLLGDGSGNVIPFDHPKFGELYCSEVKKLVTALKTNPKATETRVAFRTLIGCIVVHPGRKRMPYEYTPYLNSAALFGKQLFPEKGGKGKEIGKSAYYNNGGSEKSVSS